MDKFEIKDLLIILSEARKENLISKDESTEIKKLLKDKFEKVEAVLNELSKDTGNGEIIEKLKNLVLDEITSPDDKTLRDKKKRMNRNIRMEEEKNQDDYLFNCDPGNSPKLEAIRKI